MPTTRLTIDQLEKMKTHELADLLSNVVILLRRMPNVECKHLEQQIPSTDFSSLDSLQPAPATTSFTEEKLMKNKLPGLKVIAKELNLSTSGTKADLVKRILARSSRSHSEQYAIQNI